MHRLWETFIECGWPAYLVLLLGMVAGIACLGALIMALSRTKGAKVVSVLALAVAVLAVGTGVGGTFLGRSRVDSILHVVEPAQREQIRMMGYAEAQQCTHVGFGLGGLPLVMGVAALAIAFIRPSEETA